MKELLKIASILLKVYFSKFPVQQILRERDKVVYSSETEYALPVRDFIPYVQRLQQKNSEAEINCQISSLLQEIKTETNTIPIRKIIDFFSDYMINRFHDDYRFSFEYCDVWRETIVLVDEETFVISKIIQENQRRGISHISNYTWPNCIEHDNLTISSILNSGEGVSDNHFHLRASSPYYQFSWIKMMNSLIDDTINRNLKLIDEKRLTQLSYYTSEYYGEKLSILHIKAAAIRIYLTLYLLFGGDESKISKHFVSANIERILLLDIIPLDLLYELQRTVDYLHFHFETYDNTDYIGSLDSDEPLGELYGERKFISSCLMLCDKYIDSLLFVYLAIKNHFRIEIIQSNGLIGFNNFFQFQERKGWFIPWSRESEKKLTTATISDVIYGPRLNSLELRIVPASLYKPDTDLIAENKVIGIKTVEGAKRFELWEKNVASLLGLTNAIKECLDLGFPRIQDEIVSKTIEIRETISNNPNLTLVGKKDAAIGNASFYTCNALLEKDVKTLFDTNDFIISCMCDWDCPLFFPKNNIKYIFRITPHYYTPNGEVRKICELIRNI